jgi:methyl-accepting chemotaxis protein
MSDWFGSKTHTIGIIGGGRGGHGLLKVFLQSTSGSVAYVVDPNYDSPGIVAARDANIRTFTDMEEALKLVSVDIIFEMTGVQEISDRLTEALANTNTKLITHHVGRIFVDALRSSSDKIQDQLTSTLTKIRGEITSSLDGSRNLVSRINQIMSSMQMLVLNASIEAAKVGVHGKGFMVVADHMTKSVESVRNLTKEIETMNTNIMLVSEQIDDALKHLK